MSGYPPGRVALAFLAAMVVATPSWAQTGRSVQVAAPLSLIPPDAQGAAMGEAFTALARGPEAAWWNPSALALGRGLAGIPYSRSDRLLPGNDVRLEQFAASWGGGGIGFGATWTRWQAVRTLPIGYVSGESAPGDPRNRQQVATIGFGIDLARFAVALPRRAHLSLGAAARGYREECSLETASDAAVDRVSAVSAGATSRYEGWDLDGAALLNWRWAEPSRPDEEQGTPGVTGDLCLGYVAMNNLDREQESCAGRLPMGRLDRASGALVLRIPLRWPVTRWINLSAAFERRGLFLQPGVEDRPTDHLGGEISFGGILAGRIGEVRGAVPAGGGGGDRWLTWGFGLASPSGSGRARRPGFGIDYASLGRPRAGATLAKQITVWVRLR
jgi:hypothetical protein